MDRSNDQSNLRSAALGLRSFFLWAKLGLLALILVLSAYIYLLSTSPYVQTEMQIFVQKGEGSTAVLKRLHRQGVLPNYMMSLGLMYLFAGDTKIVAGEYLIPQGSTPLETLALLNAGATSVAYKLTFTEGVYVEEILDTLRKDGRLSGDLSLSLEEGALFPDTYHVQRYERREDIVKLMSDKMKSIAEHLLKHSQNPYIRTVNDLVILASLIEREAANSGEMARICGVFVNRMAKRMRLQSDPTVVYALTEGKFRLNRKLRKEDMKVDSDYNTYRRQGLPKGPICCPGLNALKAAANPQRHDELYFAVVPDGSGHYFSTSYKDHVNYINKHLKNRRR